MKTTLEQAEILDDEAIHSFFGLTYANYLVLPRVALQSMPSEWQRQFVKLLEAIPETLKEYNALEPETYLVSCKNLNGMFVKDKFPHYQRGRARIK